MNLRRNPEIRRKASIGVLVALGALLSSCAGDYSSIGSQNSNDASTNVDVAVGKLPGVRVSFHFSDYYSLSNPRSDSSCAGDVKNYYHPLGLTLPSYPTGAIDLLGGTQDTFGGVAIPTGQTAPMKLPDSLLDSSTTTHPSFVRNVSVDLTNSNSNSALNVAFSCSLGNGPSAPPSSSCATFDYGAIGGLPTNLGGSLFLIGGLHQSNYSGINSSTTYHGPSIGCGPASDLSVAGNTLLTNTCSTSLYALGINTLPASAATDPPSSLAPGITSATGPLSSWGNLSTSSSYAGPTGLVGAGVAYDPEVKRILAFGGASPFSATSTTGAGAPSNGLWQYDVISQAWTQLTASSVVDSSIQTMLDINTTPTPPQTNRWQKTIGARTHFGYRAAQGFALAGMSTTGATSDANIDLTDRIIAAGGYGSYGYDTRKFNPTYGPDWIDTAGAADQPTQWLDSYHTQLLSNHVTTSGYAPGSKITVNSAFAPVRDNQAGRSGAGYLMGVKGFEVDTNGNAIKNSSTAGGVLSFEWRGSAAADLVTSSYAMTPNFQNGVQTNTQGIWADLDATIPWYGGAVLLPGLNLRNNDLVYFGGSDCPDYLSRSSSSSCKFDNAGVYWSLGTNPAAEAKSTLTPAGAPSYAGMAAERGVDGLGNPLIVAFGGAKASAVVTDPKIYYLYSASGTPTWVSDTAQGSPQPQIVADGALVFSHVTRKFYLFGGYQPAGSFFSGDTWELSVSGACTGTGTCTFTWRQLTSGVSCYPNCPVGRYGHRMTEANYYNRNPGGTVTTADGESACTDATQPCSYGIFMEGGTSDGTTRLADRWMFDPTANGGNGHWQLMTELPPRQFTAMTTIDYRIPSRNKTVHRALLFGGETGMQNPQLAANANGVTTYFVPPTLGDTWMYDFDQNVWNRAMLLGKGWNVALPNSSTFATESDAREAYTSTIATELSELSPPPLSGAVMVTRTVRNSTHVSGDPTTPLPIPEVFLFGGRKKDGTYLDLSRVYKFCAGTTGEKPYIGGIAQSQSGAVVGGEDDASCDAYDSTTNIDSPSPTDEFKGRWLRKTPTGSGTTSTQESSFLGSATYDPDRDVIVLYGGLKGTSLPAAVTDLTSDTKKAIAGSTILEYTPPSKTTTGTAEKQEGIWTLISTCSGSTTPSGRYAHTMTYDALNKQFVIVGGYDTNGALLAQTVTYYDGRTFQIPEVWVAKRSTNPDCYTWSQITLFSNSIDIPAQTPPYSGIAHAAGIFLPSDGYNTGYYTMMDPLCVKSGPIGVPDPSVNRLLAGGAYIDLDRSKLGERENLLLNLTFIPMGIGNQYPDRTLLSASDAAVFKIHLVKTGLSLTDLRLMFQPRYMMFSDTEKYPEIVQSIAVIAPPSSGQPRQEQVILPISIDPSIDQIRIERYSGSGILIDATLFRLGKAGS